MVATATEFKIRRQRSKNHVLRIQTFRGFNQGNKSYMLKVEESLNPYADEDVIASEIRSLAPADFK